MPVYGFVRGLLFTRNQPSLRDKIVDKDDFTVCIPP